MKKTSILFLLLTAALLLPNTAFMQSKPRLAIFPFTGVGGADGETIAMLLGNREEISSVFTVVPRTKNVEAIMKEQRFQRSGLTDSDTIYELGKHMNADYVAVGHIVKLGESKKLVFISIIHVETFQLIAGEYKEYENLPEIRGYLPDMSKELSKFSLRKTSGLPKLAVAPFNISKAGVDVGDAEVLAQILAIEIAKSGKYAALPRTTIIEAVMKEQEKQREGLTDPNTIKAIGKATNAEYVLAGTISSLGSMNLFLAQILNVEDGYQSKGADVEYKDITDGLTKMGELSYILTGIKSDSDKDSSQTTVSMGWIDENTYRVEAEGDVNSKLTNKVQRRESSKIAAILNAQYQVLEKFKGSLIERAADMSDFESTGSAIAQEVLEYIKNGSVVSATWDEEDNCEIIYEVKAQGLKKKCTDAHWQ